MNVRNIKYLLTILIILIDSNVFCNDDIYLEIDHLSANEGIIYSRRFIGLPIDPAVSIDQLLVSEISMLQRFYFAAKSIRSAVLEA